MVAAAWEIPEKIRPATPLYFPANRITSRALIRQLNKK